MDSFSSVNLTIEMMKVKTDAFGFTNKSLRFNAKIQVVENNNTTFRETVCTVNQENLCCALV